MTHNEFRRYLLSLGAVFKKPKKGGSHYRVTLNGHTTIFADHGTKEMGKTKENGLKKQLGLK